MVYDEETMRQLRNADWKEISCNLLKFATALGGNSIIAKGMDCDDIVRDVIYKTFTGERKWNPQIALYVHLKEAVRSSLSKNGLYGSKDRVCRISIPSEELEICVEERSTGMTDEILELQKIIKGKIELERVLEVISEGVTKSGEIARLTGHTPEMVTEFKRVLKCYWIKIKRGITYEK